MRKFSIVYCRVTLSVSVREVSPAARKAKVNLAPESMKYLSATDSCGDTMRVMISGGGTGVGGASVGAAWPLLAGLTLEAFGLVFHARDLKHQGGEGAASHYEQTTTFGYSYRARNLLLVLTLFAVTALALSSLGGVAGLAAWLFTLPAIVAAAVIGRMLFYALVIPTTMPGAFFWHNRGFEEHARKTGLAAMPQVGVVMDGH